MPCVGSPIAGSYSYLQMVHLYFRECRTAQQKLQVREAQVEASHKAVENSRALMQHSSSVTYLEVLTAQSSWLTAQLQQTADWLELQQGKINLYKALCR